MTDKQNEKDKKDKKIEVYSEKAETKTPEMSEDEIRAAALAYAIYLKKHNLKPGDATFMEPDEKAVPKQDTKDRSEKKPGPAPVLEVKVDEVKAELESSWKKAEAEASGKIAPEPEKKDAPAPKVMAETETRPEAEPETKAYKKTKKEKKTSNKQKKAKKKKSAKKKAYASDFLHTRVSAKGLPAIINLHDRLQDIGDETLQHMGVGFAKGAHQIASTYTNSRRNIGIGMLVVGLLAAGLLIVFDRFTLYEYAYNGKVLGYVHEQEEVTEVLDLAGDKLTQNNQGEASVEFSANQNITFKQVDARGKTADDADTAVNKLIYMTDIETEAYAVYDGDRIVAVVKDSGEAEELLAETKAQLSTPDSGMELISSDFVNKLDIKPINVLLTSVQSRAAARYQMVNGGKMQFWHIVEEGETVTSLTEEFGVDPLNVYTEDNEIATEVDQGDKVCIRTEVEPVSVEMVESGRIKEIVEYETVKKDSDEYYKGDTHIEQEGVNGVQIFEGTLTKVGGEVTDRDEISTEVIREKKDKIILVGTAERPKTAPTGTFQMPIETYVITSEWGGRWGRLHEGMDFGASTGTPIYASDGGEVVTSGIYGGYGYCINIDHGNGKMTRYGHCSKLLVNVGDKVYQGQEIALVGNTGHSFGSHLHFEIRENGTSVNPRKYINP